MVASHSDGSQTTSGTTIHTLDTITTAGVFLLMVDTDDMVDDDILALIAELKVRSGGTTREVFRSLHANAQNSPIIISPPIATTNELVFKLQAQAGTITIPFEIIQVDGT